MKKTIKTNEGLFEMGVEELIPKFDAMIKKFSHRCVESLSGYESNAYDFEDYYQIGVVELMGAFERYDHTKGATFFTHLHRELHYRMIMIMREFEADKRKNEQPLLFLNKEVEGVEISNIVKGEDDVEFDDNEDKLEEFMKKNLTKTERILIAVHFKKSYNKSKGLYKNSLGFAIDSFSDTMEINFNKSELAEMLNISRPTLNKRINEAVEKVKELTEYYIHKNEINYFIN